MEAAAHTIGALDPRGRERGKDLGTLVRLCFDSEMDVALLELHDPERFNTMGWALGDDMRRAIDHLRKQHLTRALTLQGAGSVFCAGGNPYGASRAPTLLAGSARHLLDSLESPLNLCVLLSYKLRVGLVSGSDRAWDRAGKGEGPDLTPPTRQNMAC